MMSGISNKKFLALFAMVAACMAASSFSTVNAAGVRRRRSSNERQQSQQQNNRSLKSSKSSKAGSKAGSKGSSNSADSSSASVTEDNAVIVNEPKVVNSMSIEGFGIKCPSETNALDSCLGQNEGNNYVCKTCLIGLATLASVDEAGLRSCSNVRFGAHCKEACYTETQNYFNCGADKNLGVTSTPATDTTPTTTTDTTTTAGSNSVVTGGGTGTGAGAGSGSGSGTSADTFKISGYAPATVCPMDTPESGDSCVMQEYQYLDCYFATDKIRCTCRHDQKKYLCNAE